MKIKWLEAWQIIGEIIDVCIKDNIDIQTLSMLEYERLVSIIYEKDGHFYSSYHSKWIERQQNEH